MKSEKRRKPSVSKLMDLQRKLQRAAKERDSKNEANERNDDPEDHSAVYQNEMDKAMARIKGEKVKDDVQKLRKTIRKEKRKTQKSREEWAKRVESVDRDMKARQEKREKNLKERRDAKKAGVAKSNSKSRVVRRSSKLKKGGK